MNVWDILILLLVAGMVLLAVRAMRSGGSCKCGGCDRNCAACGKNCKEHEKTDRP